MDFNLLQTPQTQQSTQPQREEMFASIIKTLNESQTRFIPTTTKLVSIQHNGVLNDRSHCQVEVTSENTGAGQKIKCTIANFKIPAIRSTSAHSKAAYCDYPGINILRSIETFVSKTQTESLDSNAILIALKNMLGEGFEKWAKEKLGGCKGSLQKTHTATEGEIILPELQILLPLPIHLFRNVQMIEPMRCSKINIRIDITANKLESIISRSNLDIENNDIPIEFTNVVINPAIIEPQCNTSPLIVDSVLVSNTYNMNNGNAINFNGNLATTELFVNVFDNTSASPNAKYLSNNTYDGFKAFWDAHIKFSIKEISNCGAIEFNSCMFFDVQKQTFDKSCKLYSIIDCQDNQFTINYSIGNNSLCQILIKSTIPFKLFPKNIFLDLETFPVGEVQALSFLEPKHFSNITLSIVPFNPYEHIVEENGHFAIYNATKGNEGVARALSKGGLFEFTGEDRKKYVFQSTTDIFYSKQTDLKTISILINTPVPAKNSMNSFVAKKLWKLNRPHWGYWDLNGEYPIRIKQYSTEVGSGAFSTQNVNSVAMELGRGALFSNWYNFEDVPLHINSCYENHGSISLGKISKITPMIDYPELKWSDIKVYVSTIKPADWGIFAIVQNAIRVMEISEKGVNTTNDNLQTIHDSLFNQKSATKRRAENLPEMMSCNKKAANPKNYSYARGAAGDSEVIEIIDPDFRAPGSEFNSGTCKPSTAEATITRTPCNKEYRVIVPGTCEEQEYKAKTCWRDSVVTREPKTFKLYGDELTGVFSGPDNTWTPPSESERGAQRRQPTFMPRYQDTRNYEPQPQHYSTQQPQSQQQFYRREY